MIEIVSNELADTDTPLPEHVKNKRHDITRAHTYLNKSIISPDIEIYTYYADYPERNDTMNNSTMTIDQAKLISPNETSTIPKDTQDSTFRIDLSEFDPPSETTTTYTNDNADTVSPELTESGWTTENTPNHKDKKFSISDIDQTIFDSAFLPPKITKNDAEEFYVPREKFNPLPIPDYYYRNEHKNVKRHKSDPFTYLPPTQTIPVPSITNKKLNSNGISIDLQRNAHDGHQLDVRFGTDVTQQQQQFDHKDSSTLQQFSQQIATSKDSAQAYYYTSFENYRPRANNAIQPPPLQSYYPASIQNNYASRAVRPLQYRSTPIPASLPSIVYSPTAVRSLPNHVQQSVKIPIPPSLEAASNAQYYSAPAITSQYAPRPCDLPLNGLREKVVVKIVPANGWYLNDEKERKSYYDAVANGLLNENGFVYVNDVQRYNSESTQNVPTVWYSSSVAPQAPPPSPTYPAPPLYRSNQRWELPQYGSPVSVLQEQQPRQPESRQLLSSSSPLTSSLQARQLTSTSEGSQLEPDDRVYNVDTSYSVPLQSVGKLVGDNRNETYSLASLRSSRSASNSNSSSTDRILNGQNVR